MNRILGLIIVLAWAAAFSLLMARDVIPLWRAQQPPSSRMPVGEYQIGLFDGAGARIGTSWVSLADMSDASQLQSTTELTNLAPLNGLVAVPRLLVDSMFMLSRPGDRLQSFNVDLRAGGESLVEVEGTLIGQDFACRARFGNVTREFSLDARATAVLSESLRPFNYLADLHVGQSWQIRMIDFMSLLRDREARFTPQLVRVTGRERIRHAGRDVECFRIETANAVAWADDSGRVLLQRVSLPLLATIDLRDEPFSDELRRTSRRANASKRPAAPSGHTGRR